MICFEASEEQTLIQQSVADFAKSKLLPHVREAEAARAISDGVRQSAHEMGLGLMGVPETCGGQGLGCVASVLVEEELGAADAAAAFALPGPGAFGRAVLELGSAAQAEALLGDFAGDGGDARFGAVAWSEPSPCKERAGFTTVATRIDGGFTLRGKKAFVTNARAADRFVVFAQVDADKGWDGIGAFVVRRDNPGLAVGGRHDTLGLDAADFGEITLNDAKVSDEDRLAGERGGFTQAALRFFAKQALVVAARAVGVARFAFEIAREHCDTRKAFGKPIGHFQAVAFALADRHMDVESARWMVWRAAHAWDASLPENEAILLTARAAAHALEGCMRTADDCVGLHGGSGFIRDLVAEKLMRDAKMLALCCPTPEQLDQVAAAIDLGVALDPALVLPTPDTQAIFT